jgi:hypothetical protein
MPITPALPNPRMTWYLHIMQEHKEDGKTDSVDPQGDWPGTVRSRDELDSALEEGVKSGRSPLTHDEIIAEARRDLGIDG